jgi:hypothetical protein
MWKAESRNGFFNHETHEIELPQRGTESAERRSEKWESREQKWRANRKKQKLGKRKWEYLTMEHKKYTKAIFNHG